MVKRLNPTTGTEENRHLNKITSSHLAQRTSRKPLQEGKAPNLVGSLSSHKEGSKAFARYRDIDEDVKKEFVNIFE